MGWYYLTTYVGKGLINNPYRPFGADQPNWSSIDLRPPGEAEGPCLLYLPTRDDKLGMDVLGGDAKENTSLAAKVAIERAVGVAVLGNTVAEIVAELLIEHGRDDGTKWKLIQPDAEGYKIYLGDLLWSAPAIKGGSVSSTFGGTESPLSEGGVWTSPFGSTGQQNKFSGFVTGSGSSLVAARYNTTGGGGATIGDDQYSEIEIETPASIYAIALARLQSGACSGYAAQNDLLVQWNLRRYDNVQADGAGQTSLADYSGTPAQNDLVRVACVGSSISAYVNGSLKGSVTDSTYTSGQPGIGSYDIVGNAAAIDSWIADVIAASGLSIPVATQSYRRRRVLVT